MFDGYHGDNFVRYSGEVSAFDEMQLFSFQSMKQHGTLGEAGKDEEEDDPSLSSTTSSSSTSSSSTSSASLIPQVYNYSANRLLHSPLFFLFFFFSNTN
jgi:hypothetical protein